MFPWLRFLTTSPDGGRLGRGLEFEPPQPCPFFPGPSHRERREISKSKFLLVPQCHQRIDFRRAARGNVSRDQRYRNQQPGNKNEGQGIGGAYSVEQTHKRAR